MIQKELSGVSGVKELNVQGLSPHWAPLLTSKRPKVPLIIENGTQRWGEMKGSHLEGMVELSRVGNVSS
jgi:hypothetical protein